MNANLPPGVSEHDIDPRRKGLATVEITLRVTVEADCDDTAVEDAENQIELPSNARIVGNSEVYEWDFS